MGEDLNFLKILFELHNESGRESPHPSPSEHLSKKLTDSYDNVYQEYIYVK